MPRQYDCISQALDKPNFMDTCNRGFLAPTVSRRDDFSKVFVHVDCIPGNEKILSGIKLHEDGLAHLGTEWVYDNTGHRSRILLPPTKVSVGSDQQHRDGGIVEDLQGDAAKDPTLHAGVACCCENNEFRPIFF